MITLVFYFLSVLSLAPRAHSIPERQVFALSLALPLFLLLSELRVALCGAS